jgi:hypothetical protein
MKASGNRKLNLKIAVLSLGAAAIFWLMNALNKDGYSTKLAYPLQIQYNDSLYCNTLPLPKRLFVNISGNGWALFRRTLALNVSPIIYPITQPLKTKYINTTSLTNQIAEQIKDVKVNYIVADTLDLDFDKKISRKLYIRVDSAAIDLRKPFVVSSLINISPETITIEGPSSILSDVSKEILVPITRKHIDSDYDNEILLDLPKGQNIKSSADKVQVSFEVAALQIPVSSAPTPLPVEKENKVKKKEKSKK